jgi:phenylacetate-CoA ligase
MSIEDRLYPFLNFYKRTPTWIKRILVFPFSIFPREKYLGKNYKIFMKEALSYEFLTEEQIKEFQFLKLNQVIKYAYRTVPFYRNKWNEHGINLNSIQSFDDFSKTIPFTTRADVQKDAKQFIPEIYSVNDYMKMNTGGSTGIPLEIYFLKGYTRIAYNVYTHLIWQRFGYEMGDCYARLRGDVIGKNRLYTYDPYRKSLMLSSFGLNEKNANYYLELIRKYKVKYIAAYPASLYTLMQLSTKKSFHVPSLKAIMLGSENVLDFQLDKMRSFFQIENISINYGHGESVNYSANCEKSMNYHFYPGYSYTEFCDTEDSRDIISEENVIEIVGTAFLNPAMPLIRYCSQDFGIVGPSDCSCGRNHKTLKKVIGRTQEVAIGFNGERITLTALIFGRHMEYLNHIIKIQVINFEPGKLVLKVIPKDSFNDDNRDELNNSFSKKDGLPFEVEVQIVNEIKSTTRGKHKFFIKTF